MNKRILRPVKCEECGEIYDVKSPETINHEEIGQHMAFHIVTGKCYKKVDNEFKKYLYEYYQAVYTLEMMEKWITRGIIKI